MTKDINNGKSFVRFYRRFRCCSEKINQVIVQKKTGELPDFFSLRSVGFGLLNFFILIWLATTAPIAAFAADEIAPAAVVEPVNFPGLPEVVPKSSQLKDDLAQMTSSFSTNVNLGKLTDAAEKLAKDWQVFNNQVLGYGELEKWPVNRLLQAQTEVEQKNQAFGNMLELVSKPLSAFEEIRVTWSARQAYWSDWEKSLQKDGSEIPRETFRMVDKLISQSMQKIEVSATRLVQLQQQISKDRDGILALREKLDTELGNLRRDPFKRNAHPLLSKEFIQQFDQALRVKAVEGLQATFQFQSDFFSRQGWLLALQAVLALLLFKLFRVLEHTTAERTEEWGFVFRRPIAAALFIASTIPQLFYLSPPPVVILSMSALAVFSAARIAAALITDKIERRYIYVLATVYIFLGVLNVTGAPPPYHRLYFAALCLIGIPALLFSARKHLRREGLNKVATTMILGFSLLVVVLTAELSGYQTFAAHLIEATFGTILLFFLTVIMLRIGEGGIAFTFSAPRVANKQFIKQLGPQAKHRFKNLLRIIVVVTAINYIFEVWGLAKGFGNVWDAILSLEIRVGEFQLSLQMILLVALVLYLTLLISWFIQALIESQLAQNNRIDRGVRDAIKKLGHYALILIGFLIAMSMSGIALKNFTILAGAFGIGIGFGLQDIVNNFVSGLILLFERPVKVGDTVIVGDNWGVIKNIGMRSTVVETWDLAEIIVPNSQMISEKVTNWTLSSNVSRLVLPVGIKYGTDMKQVMAILEKVAHDQPEVVKTPPPSAIFTEFGDNSLNFELRVWIGNITDRFKVRSALGVAIADEFNTAGIEIPFPQRDLHLRSIEPEIMDVMHKHETLTKKPAEDQEVKPNSESESDQ